MTTTKNKARKLSQEEEYDLFRRYQETGSPRAKAAIVAGYKPLIYKCATKTWYRSPRLEAFDFDDLHQEALIGLLLAIERFDLSRGLRFATCATRWIEGRLSKYVLENCYGLRVNARFIKKTNEILESHKKQLLESGEATDAIDVDHSKLSSEHSSLLSVLSPWHYSIEGDADLDALQIEDESVDTELEVASKIEIENLCRAIDQTDLTDRERDILRVRFQDDTLTLREVSEKYDISMERVRQVQNRALEKIRKTFEGMKLKPDD